MNEHTRFLLINGLKGLAGVFILLGGYFLFVEFVTIEKPEVWIERFYAQPVIIYLIYFASEFFFGIIPPEFFMIWALNKSTVAHYFVNLAFFAAVSYAMGYLNFLIGRYFYKHEFFLRFRAKFLSQLWPMVKKYGLFLIIVAALTPLPWSAVSLLVGSADYPAGKYLKYALFRFLRYAFYGFIIYQSNLF